MAFQKADPKAILNLSEEEKNDILRAFAVNGNTIETIAETYGLFAEDVNTFLDNRRDEIMALKDFYSKMFAANNGGE